MYVSEVEVARGRGDQGGGTWSEWGCGALRHEPSGGWEVCCGQIGILVYERVVSGLSQGWWSSEDEPWSALWYLVVDACKWGHCSLVPDVTPLSRKDREKKLDWKKGLSFPSTVMPYISHKICNKQTTVETPKEHYLFSDNKYALFYRYTITDLHTILIYKVKLYCWLKNISSFDISKAFDKVWHWALHAKLLSFGLTNSFSVLITCFFYPTVIVCNCFGLTMTIFTSLLEYPKV